MAEETRGWELRLGVWATEQQAHVLQAQVHRLLCPEPEHAPPSPIPWEANLEPFGDDASGRYSALLEQVRIEYLDEV